MKTCFSMILTLLSCVFLFGMVSSQVKVTKCIHCETTVKSCEEKSQPCKVRGGDAGTPAQETTTATPAPAPKRLVKRDDEPPPADAKPADAAAPAASMPKVNWMCITVVGQETKGGDDMVFMGCTRGDCLTNASRKTYLFNESCWTCGSDDCNLSTLPKPSNQRRINPIGWIFLLTAMFCFGLE